MTKDRSIKAVIERLRFGDSDGDDHDIAADELERRQQTVESLRRDLADPPADVQEAVLRKLNLWPPPAPVEPRAPRTLTEMSQQVLPQVTRAEALLSELPTAELYNRVGQLLAGWKQGCAPGEWSDFDESVLQAWQSWRVMQMRRHQNDLPSACGERFGNGAHHECCREPNHPGKCRCSCGAENRQAEPSDDLGVAARRLVTAMERDNWPGKDHGYVTDLRNALNR